MYIRNRVRGTNQHTTKGSLEECVICSKCGAFNNEFEPHKVENGFVNPKRERVKNCHRCNQSLLVNNK